MTDNELKKLKNKTLPIFRRYGVSNAGVFGSYARGEMNKESDIDFSVEIKNDDLSLLDFIGMKQEVEKTLGREVDIVEYSALKPSFQEKIKNEIINIL